MRAASGGIGGRSISRNSGGDGATFSAARTFSDNSRTSRKVTLRTRDTGEGLYFHSTEGVNAPTAQDRAETRIRLHDVLLENLAPILLRQPADGIEARLVVVEEPAGLR